MLRGDLLDPAGELDVERGHLAPGAVGVHRDADLVVAEGQIGVVVELLLDGGDLRHHPGRLRMPLEDIRPREPVVRERPAGELLQTLLDLLVGERLDCHDTSLRRG
ncbi:hypothetical protein GCM10017744_029260 [Streptomyces antimycoticus]